MENKVEETEKIDAENDLLILICPSCEKAVVVDKKKIEKNQIFEPCYCGRMVPLDGSFSGDGTEKRIPRY